MEIKIIAILAVTIITLYAGFKSKKAQGAFRELISKKRWLINVLMIIGFIIYIYYETNNDDSKDSKKTKEALQKAIIAFIIGLLSELGLTIAPFWLVFVFAYYMEGWI